MAKGKKRSDKRLALVARSLVAKQRRKEARAAAQEAAHAFNVANLGFSPWEIAKAFRAARRRKGQAHGGDDD